MVGSSLQTSTSLGGARFDLETLHLLPKDYKPRTKPFCLVIGPGGEKEASAIREFHREKFIIAPFDVFAGVSAAQRNDRYDYLVGAGSTNCDLRYNSTWSSLLNNNLSSKDNLDLIWTRNPELEFTNHWINILSNGINRLTSTGVFVMVIRQDDIEHISKFTDQVSTLADIKLVINQDLDFTKEENNFGTHKTLLVFKKS